jgi:hypothetical protein
MASEESRAYSREWRARNKDKVAEYNRRQRKVRAENKRRWERENPEKNREYVRRWRSANPNKKRAQGWRSAGIDPIEARARLDAHDGKCELCGKDHPGGGKGWHIDHDHKTGHLRGVLCCGCNLHLGWFEKVGHEAIRRYLTPKGMK